MQMGPCRHESLSTAPGHHGLQVLFQDWFWIPTVLPGSSWSFVGSGSPGLAGQLRAARARREDHSASTAAYAARHRPPLAAHGGDAGRDDYAAREGVDDQDRRASPPKASCGRRHAEAGDAVPLGLLVAHEVHPVQDPGAFEEQRPLQLVERLAIQEAEATASEELRTSAVTPTRSPFGSRRTLRRTGRRSGGVGRFLSLSTAPLGDRMVTVAVHDLHVGVLRGG